MTYRIIFEVYDNRGKLKSSEKLAKDLTDPTAKEIKDFANPGTYTDIISEKLTAGAKEFADDAIVNVPFLNYTIHLS